MPPAHRTPPPDFFSPQVLVNRRFYLDLGGRRSGALSVVAAGFETCSPAYVVQREAFPFYAVELVAGGEGRVELDGVIHPLARGSVFAYSPSLPHRISSSSAPLQKYFITFRGSSARRLLQEAALPAGTCRKVERSTELGAVWDEVLQLGASTDPGRGARVTLGLRFLLTLIGERRGPELPPSRARRTILRCEAYLQQNFLTIHRLRDVAEACNADLPYLCRLSRRFLGLTLHQYLQRLKMNWAAERLQGTRLVRQVAEELGLDPFQFSRAFKRTHGLAPSEFQRLYGGRHGEDD